MNNLSYYANKLINDNYIHNNISYTYEYIVNNTSDIYKATYSLYYLFIVIKEQNIYKYYFYIMYYYFLTINELDDIFVLEDYFEYDKLYKIENIKEWNIINKIINVIK